MCELSPTVERALDQIQKAGAAARTQARREADLHAELRRLLGEASAWLASDDALVYGTRQEEARLRIDRALALLQVPPAVQA